MNNPSKDDFTNSFAAYLEHVKSHSPESLEGAFCLVLSETGDGNMHVCQFTGGRPDLVADAVFDTIQELVKQVPGFAERFEERAKGQIVLKLVEKIEAAVKHAEDVKKTDEITEAALERMKKGPLQ